MRALLLLILLTFPGFAAAQSAATLIADLVEVTGNQRLIASGNVEVIYDGTRLSAARITYDQASDRLVIEGPILIVTSDGTILTADQASLDPQLENGLLRGARLVLQQQLQLAANQIDRVDGRYSQLQQVAVTSCQICGNRPPLWEIRARRVVHDELAQQLYFDNATLRIGGVPLFWLPRMRLPDPTLTRATGFLIPGLRTTDQLGLGIKLPYFIRLGDHRDLTLTPYVSGQTQTLELRYRQAFHNGNLGVRGAVSRDTILPDDGRSYIFADGSFALAGSYMLDFNIEAVSDPAYLLDYGYADQDRLASSIALTRAGEDDLLRGDVTIYQTLREGEANASLPPVVGELAYEMRLSPALVGGTLTLNAGAESFLRTNDISGDTGRDVARLGLGAAWRSEWVTLSGLLAQVDAMTAINHFAINQDPAYSPQVTQMSGAAAITLRWPLIRQATNGRTDVLEPIVSIGWAGQIGGDVPNEDSRLVEFDEGNLFALTRFPGEDAQETGPYLSFGARWTHQTLAGAGTTLTLGRILRDEGIPAYSAASGLAGSSSEWIIAGQIDLPSGFALRGRSLMDDGFGFGKSETRINWQNDSLTLGAAYVWLPQDFDENRESDVSEWTIDATYRINDRWTLSADGRYDLVAAQPARAGIGIGWRNECVTVDLSLARRYTSSDTVAPATDFGLAVSLSGFSAGRSVSLSPGTCRG